MFAAPCHGREGLGYATPCPKRTFLLFPRSRRLKRMRVLVCRSLFPLALCVRPECTGRSRSINRAGRRYCHAVVADGEALAPLPDTLTTLLLDPTWAPARRGPVCLRRHRPRDWIRYPAPCRAAGSIISTPLRVVLCPPCRLLNGAAPLLLHHATNRTTGNRPGQHILVATCRSSGHVGRRRRTPAVHRAAV